MEHRARDTIQGSADRVLPPEDAVAEFRDTETSEQSALARHLAAEAAKERRAHPAHPPAHHSKLSSSDLNVHLVFPASPKPVAPDPHHDTPADDDIHFNPVPDQQPQPPEGTAQGQSFRPGHGQHHHKEKH
jgi:hypothetical protein